MFQQYRRVFVMHGLLFQVSLEHFKMMRRSILALVAALLVAQGTVCDGDICGERRIDK